MYLIINGYKDSYDRPIIIRLDGSYKTAKEADSDLRDTLVGWMRNSGRDDELLEKCDYDNELYRKKLDARIKAQITRAINGNKKFVYYNMYDGYSFETDEYGNLTMITTGCPSDNEYDGETYQVIYI